MRAHKGLDGPRQVGAIDKQFQAGHMALAASVEERATLRRVRVLAVPLHGGDPVVLSTAVMQRHEDSSAAGAMH